MDYKSLVNIDTFKSIILSNFKIGTIYSLLIKVKYNNNSYGMAGHQIGFIIDDINDLVVIDNLHGNLLDRLHRFESNYRSDEINIIQILYITIQGISELRLKNINSIKLNKEFTNVKDTKYKFSDKILPLTQQTRYYGMPVTGDNMFIYLDIINKQKKLLLYNQITGSDFNSMYLYKNKLLILNKTTSEVEIQRGVYSIKTDVFEGSFTDRIVNKETFVRKTNTTSITVCKDNATKITIRKELPTIKYRSRLSENKLVSNPYIGTFDIETFVDLDGYSKIYALGFCIVNQSPTTFYLDELTSHDLVIKCINLMLSNKYNNYIFYTHNLGGFDCIFMLKILTEENKKRGFDYYKISSTFKDDKILKLDIKVHRVSSCEQIKHNAHQVKYNKISFVDSLNLLQGSLDSLCQSFGLSETKGKFPHSFVNRNTLNYVGDTPSKQY